MSNRKGTTTIKTFWNDLREQAGFTLDELSKSVDIDKSTLSKYLSGAKLPSSKSAAALCDFFGVDYDLGAEKFNEAHAAWVTSHPADHKRSKIRKRKYSTKPETDDLFKDPVTDNKQLVDTITRKLYSVLSYDDFMTIALCDPTPADLLKFAYGNVDYDLFEELMSVAQK